MADREFEEFRSFFEQLPQHIKAPSNCYTLKDKILVPTLCDLAAPGFSADDGEAGDTEGDSDEFEIGSEEEKSRSEASRIEEDFDSSSIASSITDREEAVATKRDAQMYGSEDNSEVYQSIQFNEIVSDSSLVPKAKSQSSYEQNYEFKLLECTPPILTESNQSTFSSGNGNSEVDSRHITSVENLLKLYNLSDIFFLGVVSVYIQLKRTLNMEKRTKFRDKLKQPERDHNLTEKSKLFGKETDQSKKEPRKSNRSHGNILGFTQKEEYRKKEARQAKVKAQDAKPMTNPQNVESPPRLITLLAANLPGTEKLPLLVLGAPSVPRSPRTAPAAYVSTQDIQITPSIFGRWMREVDEGFHRSHRKVAFVVCDSSLCRTFSGLKSVKIIYLPVSAICQHNSLVGVEEPLVIQNTQPKIVIESPGNPNQTHPLYAATDLMEAHYYNFLRDQIQEKILKGQRRTLTLLDALYSLRLAWAAVSSSSITSSLGYSIPNTSQPTNPKEMQNHERPSNFILELEKQIDSLPSISLSSPNNLKAPVERTARPKSPVDGRSSRLKTLGLKSSADRSTARPKTPVDIRSPGLKSPVDGRTARPKSPRPPPQSTVKTSTARARTPKPHHTPDSAQVRGALRTLRLWLESQEGADEAFTNLVALHAFFHQNELSR